jgi:hypothetical protein
MLPNWRKSKGARLEFKVAKACGVIAFGAVIDPAQALYLGTDFGPMSDALPVHASWPREDREKAAFNNSVIDTWNQEQDLKDMLWDGLSDKAFRQTDVIPGRKNRYGPIEHGESCESGEATCSYHSQPHVFDDFSSSTLPKFDPFRELLNSLGELHDKKKQDYTGGEHPLANYANSGESIGVSAVASMFSRLNEKVFRLKQLHKSGAAPQNESVIDSYMDVAILSLLSILALTPGSGYEQEATA